MLETKTALEVVNTLVPAVLFTPGGVEEMLRNIEHHARKIAADLDISTPKGRQEIISLARKVATSKTVMDDAGKALTEEWRKKKELVDTDRRVIRERLDALRDEIRKPVTDYENAEKQRVSEHEAAIESILKIGQEAVDGWNRLPLDPLELLTDLKIYESRDWQLDFKKRGTDALALAKHQIQDAVERRQKHESEKAEAARQQAAKDERKRIADQESRKAREAEIARQAAEQARLEEKRRADEAAALEAARVKNAEDLAAKAEKGRLKAERETREAQEQAARDKQDAIEAEARRAAKSESDRIKAQIHADLRVRQAEEQAKRDKQAAIEIERKRVADEQARHEEEERRRASDREHKGQIHCEALNDMMSVCAEHNFGNKEEYLKICKAIISAIATGKIHNISIRY